MENIEVNCQSSIRIKYEDNIIYLDPFQMKKSQKDADFIFLTHDHWDHLSKEDILKVVKETTIIILPESCLSKIEEMELPNHIVTVKPNNGYEVSNLKFKTVAAYNNSKLYHQKDNNYVGYVLELGKYQYFVTGDTDVNLENKQVKCDYLFLPIGGEYTMDYQEAAMLTNLIKPSYVIPTHYKTVVGSDEDVNRFRELLDSDIQCEVLY